jgi:hypothetical protein
MYIPFGLSILLVTIPILYCHVKHKRRLAVFKSSACPGCAMVGQVEIEFPNAMEVYNGWKDAVVYRCSSCKKVLM